MLGLFIVPKMACKLFGTVCLVTTLIFQVILLAIFIYFFWIPSVEQFISIEVLSVTSETYLGKILPRAVTVFAFNASAGAWEVLEAA